MASTVLYNLPETGCYFLFYLLCILIVFLFLILGDVRYAAAVIILAAYCSGEGPCLCCFLYDCMTVYYILLPAHLCGVHCTSDEGYVLCATACCLLAVKDLCAWFLSELHHTCYK